MTLHRDILLGIIKWVHHFTGEDRDVRSDKPPPRKYKIVWYMVFYFSYIHTAAVYGLYVGVTTAMWYTIVFSFLMYVISTIGITAGAHRLWTHKSYKAKLPLEMILMLFQSTTNTHTLITWIRDHTLHHKYSDTDADPHNSRRGFFFCHIGWLMVRKHPEAVAKGKTIDLTELYANPVLKFQQKHAVLIIGSAAFILPTLIPLLWGEVITVAYSMNLLRVTLILHVSSIVNSVAHIWGTKPYDKSIHPVQNKMVSFAALGEGFHNYHHVFPQDYRTSEIGDVYLNLTTKFIDFCAFIGQAYDLRSMSDNVVRARKDRTGDAMVN